MKGKREATAPAPAGVVLLGLMACGLGIHSAAAQTPRPAEQAFKNIQVLKGVPEDKIQPTMWFFAASLGVRCRFCHEDDNSLRALDTKPQKLMARKMIEMTMAINKGTFGGRAAVTCYSCHRGNPKPVGQPLLGHDSVVAPEEGDGPVRPGAVKAAKTSETGGVPDVDAVLAKYEAAVGGADAAQKVSSLVIKATMQDITGKSLPVDIIEKGPQAWMVVTHDHEGDVTVTAHGDSGWRNTAEQPRARDMRPADLEIVRLEDPMYVNGRVRQVFTELRVMQKPEEVDGREAYVLAGKSLGSTAVKLYFDKESGLLSRMIYNTETLFGPYYTQVDYSDYRNAGGLKIPYRWTVARVRADLSDYRVTDLKANVPVEEARFAKPAAPPAAAK